MESSHAVEVAEQVLFLVGVVLACGSIAGFVAQKIRVPDIVLFLLVGILLGPEITGAINVTSGSVLNQIILIFGAAYIIFDSGATVGLRVLKNVWISLVAIAPIATKLPEKVNSVLWMRDDRDTLAFGNVTGAIVFQGSLLPTLGILATPWATNVTVITAAAATLIGAAWLRLMLIRGHLKIWQMLLNGALYGGYLGTVLSVG